VRNERAVGEEFIFEGYDFIHCIKTIYDLSNPKLVSVEKQCTAKTVVGLILYLFFA